VTIGIAAKTRYGECIVTVSDRSISFDDAVPSLDSVVSKDWFVGKRWGTLFAANDTCFALPIIHRANELLVERGQKDSLDDVKAAMCDAYAETRQEYVTRQYLSPFGFKSIDQFRKEGVSNLGRKLFWSLSRKINNEQFEETTFLVYGYAEGPGGTLFPHLFEVKNPGTSFMLDHLPYFAIGSGATIAMASLNLRPIGHLSPPQLVYRVLEAKFAAQSSSSVGTATTVLIANKGEPTTFLTAHTIEKIRNLWEEWKIAPPSDEINKLIVETHMGVAKA
jgi:hypothetical protein